MPVSSKRPERRHYWTFGKLLCFLLLFILSVLTLLPLILTFLYSFFPQSEIKAYLALRNNYNTDMWMDLLISPKQATVRQYYTILIDNPQYLKLFCNSVMYTVMILIGQALVVPLTSYCLTKFEFKGRDALFFVILALMLLPFQVTMTPTVITLRTLGLMDTIWAVVLPMWFSPFYIFLLRQFMLAIPNDMFEAGMMDGCGPVRSYVHVMVPCCKPILCAAAALSFADCWNMVEQPLVYLANNTGLQPLSVMFNQLNSEGTEVAFAGAALYILPALLVYLYFQEDILLGVQLSELK
jgi:multiple sugar transport system permease protein